MTDPAVAYLPGQGYGPYDRGTQDDVWLKNANGSAHLGLVWPGTVSTLISAPPEFLTTLYLGVTVFPGK
jgi:hypothetical protein